jgi:hypothetical protein
MRRKCNEKQCCNDRGWIQKEPEVAYSSLLGPLLAAFPSATYATTSYISITFVFFKMTLSLVSVTCS